MKLLLILNLLLLAACSSTPLTKEEVEKREQNQRNLRQFHHSQN